MMKAGREHNKENTLVRIGDVTFGNKSSVIIAGPCAVESENQLRIIAKGVKKAGAHMLRGGAFKPRTSPYSFQGLGVRGLELLKRIGEEVNLPVVTEILSTDHLNDFAKLVNMIQIGYRNMQNFDLLKKVARLGKPILLKRGVAATVEEFLMAAEYILNEGNDQVVLCERGIRTFENSTRSTLDLNSLALIKIKSSLPIIADPSHAAGKSVLVIPLAKAALAAGADGLLVEVHHNPKKARCDGDQALTLEAFETLTRAIRDQNHS